MRVVFTPLAERRIDALYAAITADANEERADGYVNRSLEFCSSFSAFPQWLTIDTVLIEGIYYGGRDYDVLLREQQFRQGAAASG